MYRLLLFISSGFLIGLNLEEASKGFVGNIMSLDRFLRSKTNFFNLKSIHLANIHEVPIDVVIG